MISVVIPAYNEEKSIGSVVQGVIDVLKELGEECEITLVDDGSFDNTGAICDDLAQKVPFVKVVHHDVNRGYTAAFKSGFSKSQGDVIIMMDADLQHDPHSIPTLLKTINEGYDTVSGWRKERKDTIPRLLQSFVFNYLVRVLFGINMHDVNGKPKAIRSEVIKNIDIKRKGWTIDSEILVKAKHKKYKIKEIAVSHHYRGTGSSKVRLKSIFITLIELLRLKWEMIFMRI